MWSIKLINSARLIKLILICTLINLIRTERVKVKIYDHRAQHDPIEKYGKGPWNYYGYGYGLEYQYEPDGTYERQKGYGFVKAYGRDFCKGKDESKCDPRHQQNDHQPTTSHEGEHEISNHHNLDNGGRLNLNHLNAPSITNSASSSSSSTNQVVANSDQVLVKKATTSDDESKSKLNNHQEIARFYNLHKNAPLPDSLIRLNSVDDSSSVHSRGLISAHGDSGVSHRRGYEDHRGEHSSDASIDHSDDDYREQGKAVNAPSLMDKMNFYKNKILIFDDLNGADRMPSSSDESTRSVPHSETAKFDNLKVSTGSINPSSSFNHINYVTHISHSGDSTLNDINQNNLNNRPIDQVSNDQQVPANDPLKSKEVSNDQSKKSEKVSTISKDRQSNMKGQNSQLIDTSDRAKQPIRLASDHNAHYEEDSSGEHDTDDGYSEDSVHYHSDHHDYHHHDPYAEKLDVPKIVHPAGKQLRRHRLDHHYSSSYDLSDDKHYRSTNYRNKDDDYELEYDATRLQPKFIKALMNKKLTTINGQEAPKRTAAQNRVNDDANLNKNSLKNLNETQLNLIKTNATTNKAAQRKRRTIDWLSHSSN